jgi:transketolase
MRGAFAKTLLELAAEDERILLLTADLGFTVWEPFVKKYPRRFFNVGVAEQNMIGLATGLADSGFFPFTYSIATFATLRPYEFIRNGPIHHRLPVRIVGVGEGHEYGNAGPTHHGLEDVGVMRVQPGITIIAPADAQQTCHALKATYDLPGPIYYRLGKNDNITIPGLNGRFTLGKVEVLREGDALLWVTMGGVTVEVAKAADLLARNGIQSTVLVVASINPSPEEELAAFANRFPLVITVEAHYTVGGLGSLVSEVVAEHGIGCRVIRRGVSSTLSGISGNQKYYDNFFGLNAKALVELVSKEL